MNSSITVESPKTQKAQVQSSHSESKKGQVYYLVFALLLGAMTARQESIKAEAEGLKQTAADEDVLNKDIGKLKYEELPSGTVSQTTIARIENANAQLSKQRQFIQNSLITLRQSAQVGYTEANSNVDLVEQDAAENTGYLKTLNTVFKLINSLGKNS